MNVRARAQVLARQADDTGMNITRKTRNRVNAVLAATVLLAVLAPAVRANAEVARADRPALSIRVISVGTSRGPAPSVAVAQNEYTISARYWGRWATLRQVGAVTVEYSDNADLLSASFKRQYRSTDPAVINLVVTTTAVMGCEQSPGLIVVNKWGLGQCAPHEIGHALGLGHSSAVLAGFGPAEYGDMQSIMGSGEGVPRFSQLVAIGAQEQPRTAPSGTFTLKRMSSRDRTALGWQDGSRGCWAEYRSNTRTVDLYTSASDSGRAYGARTWQTGSVRQGQTGFLCGKLITARTVTSASARVTVSVIVR